MGIVVANLSASVRWYADNLGWVCKHEEYIAVAGAKVAYLLPSSADINCGATLLQLVEPIGPSAVLDYLSLHGEGVHHVCFEVGDISEAVERLGEDHEQIFGGGRNQLACFLEKSPNGVLIELTERLIPSKTQTPPNAPAS
ncbi:MAG: hypothetical protein GXP36_01840 [Actinobacteria bacterium]|nr:hypothetical protein [Actinomycetota bacterium]